MQWVKTGPCRALKVNILMTMTGTALNNALWVMNYSNILHTLIKTCQLSYWVFVWPIVLSPIFEMSLQLVNPKFLKLKWRKTSEAPNGRRGGVRGAWIISVPNSPTPWVIVGSLKSWLHPFAQHWTTNGYCFMLCVKPSGRPWGDNSKQKKTSFILSKWLLLSGKMILIK